MSRNNRKLNTRAERKAEKEIDAFLRKVNATPAASIIAELQKLSS